MKPKNVKKTNSKVVIGTCQSSSDFYWQYNDYGQIRNTADSSKCLRRVGKKKLKLSLCTTDGTIPKRELFGYNAWDGTIFWKKRHIVITLTGKVHFVEDKVVKIRTVQYPLQNSQMWEINWMDM